MDTKRTFLCDSGDWSVALPPDNMAGWTRFRIITTVVSPAPDTTGTAIDIINFESIGCPNHSVQIMKIVNKAIADIQALKYAPPPPTAIKVNVGIVSLQALGRPTVPKPIKPV